MGSKKSDSKRNTTDNVKRTRAKNLGEPFVGGGANMIDKVQGKRIGADLNEYVIALLNEMSKPTFVVLK